MTNIIQEFLLILHQSKCGRDYPGHWKKLLLSSCQFLLKSVHVLFPSVSAFVISPRQQKGKWCQTYPREFSHLLTIILSILCFIPRMSVECQLCTEQDALGFEWYSGGWARQTWSAFTEGHNLESNVWKRHLYSFCHINSFFLTISYTENDRLIKIQAFSYLEECWKNSE